MNLAINDSLEVVNVDNTRLRQMIKYNNTLENGALQVLEGLDDFCEVLLEKYNGSVPYDKLFYALRQVISSALENDDVRNAIITGVINEKKPIKIPVQVNKVATIKKQNKTKLDINISALSNYAKSHNIHEITEHFNFDTVHRARCYLKYHHINWVHGTPGCRPNETIDLDTLKRVAKNMRLSELANMYGKTQQAMGMYLLRHNIEYIRRGQR